MFGPTTPDSQPCKMCGHPFWRHVIDECGCQLKCQGFDEIAGSREPCGCSDFAYSEDSVTPKHRLGRDMSESTDWDWDKIK